MIQLRSKTHRASPSVIYASAEGNLFRLREEEENAEPDSRRISISSCRSSGRVGSAGFLPLSIENGSRARFGSDQI